MENNITTFKNALSDIKTIIASARNTAYSATNQIMITAYWNVGKRIVEEEQNGRSRAEYGKRLISVLSEELTREYGQGFTERNLRNFRKFYLYFPDSEIWHACVPNLRWTHFRTLLSVDDEEARLWYMKEAAEQNWDYRTLSRNIATQYYYRLLASAKKDGVIAEMKEKTSEYQNHPESIIKSPLIAEFLGFTPEQSFHETELESAILTHIRDFLMEMGRGFAFVTRQQHIVTDMGDFFIDLVLYNIELKCYVLIDLKIGQISHQDVGQIDMYVRMYDDLKRKEGDNPTIGILLCSETSKDIARYSVLHDNDHLFMSKYLPYLPSKEQLRLEIEKQKEIYYAKHSDEIVK